MANEIEPPEIGRLRDTRTLWRVTAWGVCAALALAAVAVTTQTDVGTERLALVLAPAATPSRVSARADIPPRDMARESETKRLEEQVRALAADRDRLAARIASLEHNLEDMTGSIKRQIAMAPALAPSQPPVASAPATVPQAVSAPPAPPAPPASAPVPQAVSAPPAMVTASAMLPTPVAAPAMPALSPLAMPVASETAGAWPLVAKAEPEPQSKAEPETVSLTAQPVPMPPTRVAAAPANAPPPEPPRKPELGVDLGGAQTLEVLNARWVAVKANFGPLLGGLHPRVVHDDRPRAVPYRLLVGPLPNGAAAAKLCSHFAAARVTCRTVRFAGAELVQRRAVIGDEPLRHNPPAPVTTPR